MTRVLTGESVIMIGDEFFKVSLYLKGDKLKKDTAYIIDGKDIVYPYRGKLKPSTDTRISGIYKTEDDIEIIEPKEEERHLYTLDKITELDIGLLFDYIDQNADEFMSPGDVEIINNNSDIYAPTIKDSDDFLKYLVKKIILDKKINLKNYRDRFANAYALTNMKSGLGRSTKMTVTNFKTWCEILGIRWTMIVEDAGMDKLSPLPEPIEINSEDF